MCVCYIHSYAEYMSSNVVWHMDTDGKGFHWLHIMNSDVYSVTTILMVNVPEKCGNIEVYTAT